MKTCSYPWEQVVQAAYKKYPNPHSPNVVATDVVERKVNCDKIITKRILGTKWNVSYLVTKVDNWFSLSTSDGLIVSQIVGDCGLVYGAEKSWLSRSKKVLTLRTQNV